MKKLYSYIMIHDAGSAPNPYWGICTLTICKPSIRRMANIGDWVIGVGSKNARLETGVENLRDYLVYAMKVTEKLTLKEYDAYCRKSLKQKLPKWNSNKWPEKMGDCIYDYSRSSNSKLRDSIHVSDHRVRDLGGVYSLLSSHFYYFGSELRRVPDSLSEILAKSRGHRIIDDPLLIQKFEKWISQFKKNKVYAAPQLKYVYHEEGSGTSEMC